VKKLLYATLTLTTILFSGCGDDNFSISPQPNTHPTITSSQFVNYTGAKEIGVTLGFNAPVDDVVARTTKFTNAQGILVFMQQPGVSAPGQRTGTVTFSESYAGFDAGTYTLSVYLSNAVGGSSNTVTYIFTK
jgi:hypothetical protein